MKLCEFCSKLPVKLKRNKFCSNKCAGLAKRGRHHTEETKRKISESGKGLKKDNLSKLYKGKTLKERGWSDEAIERDKQIKIERNKNSIGCKFTEEHKIKLSKLLIGNTHALGCKHTEETKRNNSRARMGNKNALGFKHTEETKRKISEAGKGKIISKETKRKIRLVTIKRIEKNNGTIFPNYNKDACEYFRKFDEEHNTQGRYAVYGDSEYYIEELGYWPDYINFDMKLIIEWDEKKHYVGGKLREKDIQRQKEIQKYYPDFEFRRIRGF